MTAIVHRPPPMGAMRRRTRVADSLLRTSMRADATLCAALGLLIAFAADPLSRLSGVSATAEWIVGAVLVGYGALLYGLAAVPAVRAVGLGVVALNVAFAIAALGVLAARVLPLTSAGVAMVLSLVVATLCFAYLQYRGARRLA